MRESAASAFDVALTDVVEGDTWMQEHLAEWDGLPAIFSARAPKDAGYPRIVIGDSSEDGRSVFGRRGNTGPILLHIWCAGEGRIPVNDIYSNLVRLLEGQQLVLENHSLYSCRVRLVSNLPDPSEPLQHGVVEVTPWSLNGEG